MVTFMDKARRLDRARLALRRRYGEPPAAAVTHPVEHAVRTILWEEATTEQVDAALERFREHFADWNDLRVSRPREIRDVLGKDFPRAGHKARVIPRLLDQVFKQHNSMVWDFLEAMGKVETRKYFESLEEVRPFVAATLARDCSGAHAVPVDADVARALGRLGVLAPDKQPETEMQAFLERAVKSTRAYETHQLVKHLAEELCLPGVPLCPKCPLVRMCPSAVLPEKKPSKKRPRRRTSRTRTASRTSKKKTGKAGERPAAGTARARRPSESKPGRKR